MGSEAMSSCVPLCAAMPECAVCGLRKKPRGRSAPMEMANSLCDYECPGYDEQPKSGHLWPNELQESDHAE
jgi:hypothetical protein